MDAARTAAHNELNAHLHKKLSQEQIDKLKGLVRGIIMNNAANLKRDAETKKSDAETRRTANYNTNQSLIMKGIRFNTKEEAKELPFYKKINGDPLEADQLDLYLEHSIKDSAGMKSFWAEVESRSSSVGNMANKDSEYFITEGTKAFKKILADMRKGGDKKYARETERGNVVKAIREKTYALLPKDLQDYFENKDNANFKNLFEDQGIVATEKNRLAEQVVNHVPLDVDSEASALAAKIQNAEDKKHKPEQGDNADEKDKTAHNKLPNREFDGIIKSAYAKVQKDTDLKKVYKNPLLFRNTLKSDDLKKLIEDGLNDSVSEKEIVEAVLTILKEKQAEKSKDAK